MSWIPLKVSKEELKRQDDELRAKWGNIKLVDEYRNRTPEVDPEVDYDRTPTVSADIVKAHGRRGKNATV